MESSVDEDSEWDKSTSEVLSEDSEDLYTSRPNRWRGPPQSWRTLTEQDRLSYTALERLRNEDLSVHLYNAFALKHRPSQPSKRSREQDEGSGIVAVEGEKDIDAITGQIVTEETSWAPPRQWTAWPLNAHLVPPDDFLTRTEDEDKAFTFRRVERTTPAAELAEIISSAILRCAKDKFRERNSNDEAQDEQQDAEPVAPKIDTSPSHDNKADAAKDQQSVDIDDNHSPLNKKRAEPILKPVVATDDDLSYELLRPSAQAILAKLDQTLSILHNSRMTSVEGLAQHEIATLFSPSAAANSSEDEFDQYSFDSIQPSQQRRPRSRSTNQSAPHSRRMSQTSQAEEENDNSEAKTSSERKPRKRGRPSAFNKKEGESEREFLIRRAVMQKKRRPVFSDDDDEDQADMTDVKPAAKRQRRISEGEREKQSSALQEVPHAMESSNNQVTWTHPLDRFNLRDWSDVMGAAALTGKFSPAVIARATRRCANLFGQGMEMRKINEVGRVKTKRYVPGDLHVERPEFDSEDEDEAETVQAEDADNEEDTQSEYKPEGKDLPSSRPWGRMPSIELGGEDSPVPSDSESRGRFSTAGLRRSTRISSRSRSRGHPRKQLLYCSHPGCERATRPFDRVFNFQRHLNKVHDGEEGPGAVSKRMAIVAKGDEFLGGIHRDGFLEPIQVHRGWRGEDNAKRAVGWPSFRHQKGESPELELEGDEDGLQIKMEVEEDESSAE